MIGAGYCNDIDIISLCRNYKAVTLFDCDIEALTKVKNGPGEEEAKKIKLIQASLTGIDESDISVFFDVTLAELQRYGKLLTRQSFEEVIMTNLDKLISKMYTAEDELIQLLPRTDIAVCNGVCSQLFSIISYFIKSVAASVQEVLFTGAFEVADKAEQKLKKCNDVIVPMIVNAIMKITGDCVIFGNEYIKDHPVEGAYQCINAVQKSGSKIKELEAKWNFNRRENIVYNMLLQVCQGI